jgi:NADH-quinone oxidoreductase subunit L
MILLLLFLPLFTLIIIGLLGRYLGYKGTFILSISNFIILLLLSISYFLEIFSDGNIITVNFKNENINFLNTYPLQFFVDDVAIMMLIVIISISLIVLIYTYDYMINDPHIIRFYFYIVLFVFFMILLVTTSELPILFIG